ncbi:MAG: nucleotidyltransferase family protein [Nitrososphaerales archaeon]|jgi:mannose-1-phosphate guanylyltransferase
MSSATEAAVLCGGRGERLRPLTDYFQKVMIPIGPKKLPLLAYVIGLLRHHGVDRIALLTGYRSEDVKRYFGDGATYGVKLRYSEDAKDQRGSLNAVANALRNGAISKCDELLVYYGDVLADLDITSLLARHRSKKANATLVLSKGYTLPVGTAKVGRGGIVTSVHEKPSLSLSVTTGCMVLGPTAMAMIGRLASRGNTDLMTHLLPALLDRGLRVAAYYIDEAWYDVGTVSSFEKLDLEIEKHPLSFLVRP